MANDESSGLSPTRRAVLKVRQAVSRTSSEGVLERLADLEAEMQEARRLNRRVAELLDIVEELLVPVSQRNEEKVREYLERHSSSL
jgi:hypothetical protein